MAIRLSTAADRTINIYRSHGPYHTHHLRNEAYVDLIAINPVMMNVIIHGIPILQSSAHELVPLRFMVLLMIRRLWCMNDANHNITDP